MEFERLNNVDHAAYRRVIASDGPQVLQGKCLCELRIPGVPKEESIPQNLMLEGVMDTTNVGESAIWNRFTYQTIGHETSKNPRNHSAVDESDKKSTITVSSKVGHNDFMEPSKVVRVAEWTGQVDENVDPNTIEPEAPEQGSTRRRRVAVDSDDEDDEIEDAHPPTPKASTPKPLPELISPPPPEAEPRHRRASAAASIVASDLLKSEVAETNTSMALAAPTPQVVTAPTPEPECVTSYRTRIVRPDSDSEGGIEDRPAQGSGVMCSSIQPTAHSNSDAKPNPAHDSNPADGEETVPSASDVSNAQAGRHPAADPTLDAPAYRAIYGTFSAVTSASPVLRPATNAKALRESSPDRLSTTVSLPGRSFDPNAYGPKAHKPRGSRGSSSTSPKTKAAAAAERVQPISIPSGKTSPDQLAPLIASGGFTPTTPKQPELAPLAPYRGPSPPNGYGNGKNGGRKRGTRHRGRGGSKKAAQAQQGANNQSANLMDEWANKPQPIANNGLVQEVGKRSHGPLHEHSEDLIDVSDDSSPSRDPSPPPPGFDLRIEPMNEKAGASTPNLIDEPLEEYPSVSRATNSDLISFSSGTRIPPVSRASRASDESASYVNTVAYKGPNIRAIQNNTLTQLKAMQAKRKEQAQQAEAVKAQGQAQTKARSTAGNAKQPFRSTMNLRAGNPGKKGHPKQESKAEKKQRQEQALKEAYGEITPAKPQRVEPDSGMSKKKRQLLYTNSNMAVANPEALQAECRQQATEALVTGLSPVLEAARAFCGDVNFEFQLGQLLVSSDSSIREKSVTPKKWEKLFGPTAKTPILTSFTGALTTNGADIDRALEVKVFGGGKLWDASLPGPESVRYFFECQSKHGNQFLLVLDESGQHELRNSTITTIGMVGLHCPGQVWDACAVVHGNETWSPSAEVEATVRSFIETIHVLPNRRELVLVFRQPDDNELMIKNVSMRRVSRHQCLGPDYQDHQLQATEVKPLYTKVHPEDKKLWQAFEKSHVHMIHDGVVHYELSIIDTSIKDILSGNKTLELGELTSSSAGKQLLKGDRIKKLVDLTSHMVSKIDWMGSRNNGTLARAAVAKADQMYRQQQSLPPTARSKLNPLVAASRIDPSLRHGGSSAYPMSSAGSSEVFIGRRPLPGTRYGTLAEVYADEHGMFAKGFGGARVPLGDYSVLGAISEAPLEPDDSASQIGRAKRGGGYVGSASTARRGMGSHSDKGPGFW